MKLTSTLFQTKVASFNEIDSFLRSFRNDRRDSATSLERQIRKMPGWIKKIPGIRKHMDQLATLPSEYWLGYVQAYFQPQTELRQFRVINLRGGIEGTVDYLNRAKGAEDHIMGETAQLRIVETFRRCEYPNLPGKVLLHVSSVSQYNDDKPEISVHGPGRYPWSTCPPDQLKRLRESKTECHYTIQCHTSWMEEVDWRGLSIWKNELVLFARPVKGRPRTYDLVVLDIGPEGKAGLKTLQNINLEHKDRI